MSPPKNKTTQRTSKKVRPAKDAQPADTVTETRAATHGDLVDIDYERLKSISRLVQLEDIVLAESGWRSAVSHRAVAGAPGTSEYVMSITDVTWWSSDDKLEISLLYRLSGFLRQDDEPFELFELVARWVASYGLSSPFTPSDDFDAAMRDFVVANGQVNVFPYHRQYVQDATVRAGWPPLVLPTFRVPGRRPRHLGRRAPAWPNATETAPASE
jgi:hypothetical protein